MERNELIDNIIKFLQDLKNDQTVIIDIEPPHIEEVATNICGKVYGKCRCCINIEYKALYTKDTFKIFDNWKKN